LAIGLLWRDVAIRNVELDDRSSLIHPKRPEFTLTFTATDTHHPT
jgi:hypothetical protein